MTVEERIRLLAYSIWEQEGRPSGKDLEHYFRAKKIIEQQESDRIIELAPSPPVIELAPPEQYLRLSSRSVKKKNIQDE